jgi:hypothetical protein
MQTEDHGNLFREHTDQRIVMLEAKIDQDKNLLKTLQLNYRSKLDVLEKEKTLIVN